MSDVRMIDGRMCVDGVATDWCKKPARGECFVDAVPGSGWLWCLHCERCYPYGACRLEDSSWSDSDVKWFREHGSSGEEIEVLLEPLEMCPYPGCDGSTVMDGWEWERVRMTHKDYPVIPDVGVVYPLY